MRGYASVFVALLALAAFQPAGAQAERDPPGRVARIAYVEGSASFAPAGVQEWAKAILNRPLIAGDRLYTETGARLELELGASALRLDQRSAVEILDLDDEVAQIFLGEGRANLYVRRIFAGQVYEIATPLAAVVVRSPVSLTVEVPPTGSPLRVAVWHGRAEVVGEGRRIELVGPEELLTSDRTLADHLIRRDPAESDFDRFAFARDREFDRAESLRYVPDDLIGYRELDRYGRWTYVREYGPVWFPSRVSVGWTPYRFGHWVWLPVYGWTWIDDAPWGFAVSHYGRWIWWEGRWGWVPCPRRHRAYWAPALVVFYGGSRWSIAYSSAPVGWFPLGPGDIWLPWYSASWDYFHRINVWNTWIGYGSILSVYNTIYVGGGLIINLDYRYRGREFAWTFVPEENFRRGRPVHRHLLPVRREDIARAELRRVLGVLPTQASVKGAAPSARGVPDEGLFAREAVVTRHPSPRSALPSFAPSGETPSAGSPMRGLRLVGDAESRSGRGERWSLTEGGERTTIRSRGATLAAGEGEPVPSRGRSGLDTGLRGERALLGASPGEQAGRHASEAGPVTRSRAPSPAEISERRAGAIGERSAWREGTPYSPRRGLNTSIESRPAGGRWPERRSLDRDSAAEGTGPFPSGRSRVSPGFAPHAESAPSSDRSHPRLRQPISAEAGSTASGNRLRSRTIDSDSYRFPSTEAPRERRPGSLIERAPAEGAFDRGRGGVETRPIRPAEGGWRYGEGVRSAPVESWSPRSRTHGPFGGEASGAIRPIRGAGGGFERSFPDHPSVGSGLRSGAIEVRPRVPVHTVPPADAGWSAPPARSQRAEPPVARGMWDNAAPISRGGSFRSVEPSAPSAVETGHEPVRSEIPARSESPVRGTPRGYRDDER